MQPEATTEPVSTNALSIDVEEYFQVSAFERYITPDNWGDWPSRVELACDRILDLLDAQESKATFFTLAWIAERHPKLIRRIVDDGHELACHGYQHVRVTDQTRAQFRQDIQRSKALLEDVGGTPVSGYRAASFSINTSNVWAFEEIEAAGFSYSSSVYPVRHDLYGIPEAPRVPFRPPNTGRLTEIPIVFRTCFGIARNLSAGVGTVQEIP